MRTYGVSMRHKASLSVPLSRSQTLTFASTERAVVQPASLVAANWLKVRQRRVAD
jgi:hypothetical protein